MESGFRITGVGPLAMGASTRKSKEVALRTAVVLLPEAAASR